MNFEKVDLFCPKCGKYSVYESVNQNKQNPIVEEIETYQDKNGVTQKSYSKKQYSPT
jgi:uncharacterized Zn finger protein (UPF0148 family)